MDLSERVRLADERMEERKAQGLCEFCGAPAPLVRDPKIWELDGEEVMRRLCGDCFADRHDEI